ncbi:hypothetical protein [Neptunomonas phycophila]|uniref:hypothetical protein n=1 Tax=Neptunomonas TaxID=75687 RepID=UPI0015BB59E4|nr:hypothetical protein [Neptunomonas phycophila]QLE97470.1 hypothetical protein FLM49_07475 [Neptunomonas phycophila]
MDNRAILKSLLVSAIVTTVVLAFAGGYSSTTTPDGVTTHHYTFGWFGFWLVLLGVFVVPSTFVVGYPLSQLLFKLRIFNIYVVALSGTIGAICVVAVLFSKYPPAPMQILYYGLGGFVASVTAFVSYKNITRRSN